MNTEKLLFNWLLGRDLVQKKAEERWGAGVVEQVSLDLKREFPNAKGFSASNLWFMKRWYLFYTQSNELTQQQIGSALQRIEDQNKSKLYQLGKEFVDERLYQVGKDFPIPFALVPWRHHIEILYRCNSVEEALFYIEKTIEQGLSRDALINCIKANLYEHQGKIINNFTDHLPALQSKELLTERMRLLQKELQETKRLINKKE